MLSEIIMQDIEAACLPINHELFQNKTVLITGASGLVGTYILAYMVFLIKSGVQIEVYAQIFSEPPPHMLEIINDVVVKIVQIDLSDINNYVQLPDADVIIHSAGYAQPLVFMSNAIATMHVNISATMALLQRLRPKGSFIFISSREVYSGLTHSFFCEDDIGTTTPYHPRASYIEGKRAGEAVCNAYRTQGVRTISIRLGDIYGPGTRKHDKRAINSFIEKALCNQRIDLLDAGKAMRTSCYVSDALEMIIKITCYGKQAVYNVGGHTFTSIAELAGSIAKIIGVPVVLPPNETQVAGASKMAQLDLNRVETEFGKSEYIDLEAGLERTISWQRKLYGLS